MKLADMVYRYLPNVPKTKFTKNNSLWKFQGGQNRKSVAPFLVFCLYLINSSFCVQYASKGLWGITFPLKFICQTYILILKAPIYRLSKRGLFSTVGKKQNHIYSSGYVSSNSLYFTQIPGLYTFYWPICPQLPITTVLLRETSWYSTSFHFSCQFEPLHP